VGLTQWCVQVST